jgi:hypothetical protein
MKVKTDVITSIAADLIGQDVIQVNNVITDNIE